ncbi:MAG: hypothetical protein RI897_3580 [Verrucomicrobiota bacterium]
MFESNALRVAFQDVCDAVLDFSSAEAGAGLFRGGGGGLVIDAEFLADVSDFIIDSFDLIQELLAFFEELGEVVFIKQFEFALEFGFVLGDFVNDIRIH